MAVFPQDVYFRDHREVLSAPMTAVALLLMVKAVDEKKAKAGCCSHPFGRAYFSR